MEKQGFWSNVKKLILSFLSGIILLLVFLFFIQFFIKNDTKAHSGRTDSSGGHNCRTGRCAGSYHSHSTYTAPSYIPTYTPTYKKPTVTKRYCTSNATYSYTKETCLCNKGYTRTPNKSYCVKIPQNAYATPFSYTDAWLCNKGYLETGNYCTKIPENQEKTITAKITKIINGSTVEYEYLGKKRKLFINGIAPNQKCFGDISKNIATKELLQKFVEIKINKNFSKTNYDWGSVRSSLGDFALGLLEFGFAKHHDSYFHENSLVYELGETVAKKNKRGLWSYCQ